MYSEYLTTWQFCTIMWLMGILFLCWWMGREGIEEELRAMGHPDWHYPLSIILWPPLLLITLPYIVCILIGAAGHGGEDS